MPLYVRVPIAPTHKKLFVIVDESDADLVKRFKWQATKNKRSSTYYATRRTYFTVDGFEKYRVTSLHRFILGANPGMDVDHINGDGLDCRRKNMRVCKHAENQRNQKLQRRNKSGFKGVRQRGKVWEAYICPKRVFTYLGTFSDAISAAYAYDRAARKYFGVFACPNFPRRGEVGCRR